MPAWPSSIIVVVSGSTLSYAQLSVLRVTLIGSASVCRAEPGALSVRSHFLSAHHGLPDENLPTFAVFTLAVAKNLI